MASGMEGSETSIAAYTDPAHKHYQLEVSLGWRSPQPDMPQSVPQTGDTYRLLETFRREQPAGAEQVYTSANTALLAWLIETVTGRRLADAITERIWSMIGAEQDAFLLENARGIPIAHGGLAMTLRDVARFGLQFTPSAGWPPRHPHRAHASTGSLFRTAPGSDCRPTSYGATREISVGRGERCRRAGEGRVRRSAAVH